MSNTSLSAEREFLMRLRKQCRKEIVEWNKDIRRLEDRKVVSLDMIYEVEQRIKQIDRVDDSVKRKK